MRNFKLTLLSLVVGLLLLAGSVKGQANFGGGLGFYTGLESGSYSNLMFQFKGGYLIGEKINLRGDFILGLPKEELGVKYSVKEINFNGSYWMELSNGAYIYPMTGLSIAIATVNVLGLKTSDSYLGLNLGGGFLYPINDNLFIEAEPKFRISFDSIYGHSLAITAGIRYVLF